jgi:hypothetical protein
MVRRFCGPIAAQRRATHLGFDVAAGVHFARIKVQSDTQSYHFRVMCGVAAEIRKDRLARPCSNRLRLGFNEVEILAAADDDPKRTTD